MSRPGNIFEDVAYKAPVFVATTAAIALSGLQTIDGQAVAEGNRVLVKNQADPRENGLYNASTGIWQRTADGSKNTDFLDGTQVYVARGTLSGGLAYRVSCTDDPIIIGESLIVFAATTQGSLAAIGNNTVLGNVSGGPALAGALSQAQLQALAIPASLVALEPIGSIGNQTVVGNVSGGSAAPAALTKTQLTTLINPFTSSLSGAVPAAGSDATKYLCANATFARPPGNVVTGNRLNFELVMTNRTSTTVMEIANCNEILLTPVADQVVAGIVGNSDTLRVVGFNTAVYGDRARCDITRNGPSGDFAPGGLDTGTIQANKDYYLWIISDGTIAGTSLIWSLRVDVPNVDYGVYKYFVRVGWNRSNGGATGFAFALVKFQYRTYYVGSSLPVLYNASASRWTSLGAGGLNVLAALVAPDIAGIGIVMENSAANTTVAIAPNEFWGTTPIARITNPAGVANDVSLLVEVMSDSGGPAIWSTAGTSGAYYLAYFDEDH